MVRKVKFLSSHCTYRELNKLLETTTLKTIPLVDSKGQLDLEILIPLSCLLAECESTAIRKLSLANEMSGNRAILALPQG